MSGSRNRTHAIGIGLALAMAFVALASAVGGPARAGSETSSGSRATPTVVIEKRVFYVSNGQVGSVNAKCGSGTKIFSGGYAIVGQHARVFVAGPSRGENGYVVHAYSPPVNINAGITRENAKITVVGWCARPGEPIVLGNG